MNIKIIFIFHFLLIFTGCNFLSCVNSYKFNSDDILEDDKIKEKVISLGEKTSVRYWFIPKKDLYEKLINSYVFLISEFGEPTLGESDNIIIDVSFINIENTKTFSTENKLVKNKKYHYIKIKPFDLIKTEYHVLIHELFHVLYQNNLFRKYQPDIITEGMATYAEYLFKHKEKTYTEIKNIVLKEIATFGKYKINYEINFEEQSEIPLDLLYLKSSMLFFDKEEDLSKKIIKHIIKIGNKKNKKIKAKKLLKIYNLL